jgi:O-acetyl-ADP-ribose deacetylase (regulator of RNase III)
MTIKIKTQIGNLLHVKSGHIVHGCNAQGVMGSGVALAVKQTYPGAYKDYIRVFNSDPPFRGTKLGVAYPYTVDSELVIWNAITQDGFGGMVRQVSYDAIQTCFEQINWHIKEGGIDNVAFTQAEEVHIPMIGAARGGGNWNIISTIIEETMDYPVTLWLPDSTVTTL